MITWVSVRGLVVLVNHKIEDGLKLIQRIILGVWPILLNVITKVLKERIVSWIVVFQSLNFKLLVVLDGLYTNFEQLQRNFINWAVLICLWQNHFLEDVLQDGFFEPDMLSEYVDVRCRWREKSDQLLQEDTDVLIRVLNRRCQNDSYL